MNRSTIVMLWCLVLFMSLVFLHGYGIFNRSDDNPNSFEVKTESEWNELFIQSSEHETSALNFSATLYDVGDKDDGVSASFYALFTVAADEEFRASHHEWKNWTAKYLEIVDDYFIENFGLNFVVIDFVEFTSDNNLSDPYDIFSDAISKVDPSLGSFTIFFSKQYRGNIGGIAGTDSAIIFVDSTEDVDNVLQHEISHFFGAPDHENETDRMCVMSYYWALKTNAWDSECRHKIYRNVSKNLTSEITVKAVSDELDAQEFGISEGSHFAVVNGWAVKNGIRTYIKSGLVVYNISLNLSKGDILKGFVVYYPEIKYLNPKSGCCWIKIKTKGGPTPVYRILPKTVQPKSVLNVTITSTELESWVKISENIPPRFTYLNYTYFDADSVQISHIGNTLVFNVIDTSMDGFVIEYSLQAPEGEGTYNFTGSYQTLSGDIFSVGGDLAVVVGNETIPDNVDDTKEQIVSKYNPSFDWKTQTPAKQDVLNAVINAVIAYFSTQDDAAKQNILSDVVQLVSLYFSLGS